jgi:hypothetical protein
VAAGTGSASFPTPAGEGAFGDAAGGLIGVAVGLLAGSAIRNTDQALARLYREANGLAALVAEFVIAELWWAAHLSTAIADLWGFMDRAGDSINTLAHNQDEAWSQFLAHKYPADLRDLYDRLVARIPAQQKVNLKPIEDAIKRLQHDDQKEQTWRAKIADPRLNQWVKFYAAWKTTYAPPLRTLRDWLKHPAHLASFALPSIVAGLPSQLRQSGSLSSATSIELALVTTWTERPDMVYNAVINWLVTEA